MNVKKLSIYCKKNNSHSTNPESRNRHLKMRSGKWVDTIDGNEKQYYKRNGNVASFWGCRIYDNEEDARKSFG